MAYEIDQKTFRLLQNRSGGSTVKMSPEERRKTIIALREYRDLNVYCIVAPPEDPIEEFKGLSDQELFDMAASYGIPIGRDNK